MRLIEHIISTIAPHSCVGCGEEGSLLCSDCRDKLPRVPSRCYKCQRQTDSFRTCVSCRPGSNLYAVYAITPYEGAAKDLLWKVKFEYAQDGIRAIAESLAQAIPYEAGQVITHAPTAHVRVRMRGFDQAHKLAHRIAVLKDANYAPLLLRANSQRQIGKRRQERLHQMKDAFLSINPEHIQNKDILLIDDVITTGSTLEAAASVLKAAGAKRVSAAVFAAA